MEKHFHWSPRTIAKPAPAIAHRPYGIPGQIQQVIINLVQNALDALQHSPKLLYIVGKQDGNEAVLSIHDEGAGIAPSNLVRVFDPFFTTKPIG